MNKNFVVLIMLLLCSCVATPKAGDIALRKISSTSQSQNNQKRKIVRLTYFRNNRKILINEQRYYKGKKDGPVSQTIIMDRQILMEILRYKQTLTCHTFPTNKYEVTIAYNDGCLEGVTVSKDSKYFELFKEKNGLLIPVSDSKLKKAIKVTEAIKECFDIMLENKN